MQKQPPACHIWARGHVWAAHHVRATYSALNAVHAALGLREHSDQTPSLTMSSAVFVLSLMATMLGNEVLTQCSVLVCCTVVSRTIDAWPAFSAVLSHGVCLSESNSACTCGILGGGSWRSWWAGDPR